jgi:hypothetical protein
MGPDDFAGRLFDMAMAWVVLVGLVIGVPVAFILRGSDRVFQESLDPPRDELLAAQARGREEVRIARRQLIANVLMSVARVSMLIRVTQRRGVKGMSSVADMLVVHVGGAGQRGGEGMARALTGMAVVILPKKERETRCQEWAGELDQLKSQARSGRLMRLSLGFIVASIQMRASAWYLLVTTGR